MADFRNAASMELEPAARGLAAMPFDSDPEPMFAGLETLESPPLDGQNAFLPMAQPYAYSEASEVPQMDSGDCDIWDMDRLQGDMIVEENRELADSFIGSGPESISDCDIWDMDYGVQQGDIIVEENQELAADSSIGAGPEAELEALSLNENTKKRPRLREKTDIGVASKTGGGGGLGGGVDGKTPKKRPRRTGGGGGGPVVPVPVPAETGADAVMPVTQPDPSAVFHPQTGIQLQALASLVEAYRSCESLQPRAPTLDELRSMLTYGPAVVHMFKEAEEKCERRKKKREFRQKMEKRQPRGVVTGVCFNTSTGMHDAYACAPRGSVTAQDLIAGGELDLDKEQRPRMPQIYCGGSRAGYYGAARLRDSVMVKMYVCGERWQGMGRGGAVRLNFPPEDCLTALSQPRVVPMGWVEYADYLKTEVADKGSHRAVRGWVGVYLELEGEAAGRQVVKDPETGWPRVLAAVFDPDMRARRVLVGTEEEGARAEWKKPKQYWDSVEHAARAYDREVVRMGGFLVYKLNYPLTDYEEEVRSLSDEHRDEVGRELCRFVKDLEAKSRS